MGIEGLTRLEVWKIGQDFAVKIYREVLPLLPVEEKWALNQQIRRAVQSIPANIAEGHGRFYYQETIRFCYIARGSLEEVYSHLELAHTLGYITDDVFARVSSESDRMNRLINGYIAYLKRSRQGENEPGAPNRIKDTIEDYSLESDIPPVQD